ncbi:MAG TPA: HAD family phosphatase [Anaerolineae bacterium]
MQHTRYAIIWDLDGVLIDSGEYHFRAWSEIMQTTCHRDFTTEEFKRTFGMRNLEMLRDVLGTQLSATDVEHLSEVKEARYRELVRTEGLSLLPGVVTWLASAQRTGLQQAVASSAPRANVDAVMDASHIRDYFGTLVAAEDVSRGKPDPEVYQTAAARLGVEPSHCIIIEDAPAGVEGARRAGMACIGVLTSHPSLEADVVAPTLAAIPFDTALKLLGAV